MTTTEVDPRRADEVMRSFIRDTARRMASPIGDMCEDRAPEEYIVLGHVSDLEAMRRFVRGLHYYEEAVALHDVPPDCIERRWAVIGLGVGRLDWVVHWSSEGVDGALPLTVVELA